jgi:class 3 adenylate cyclase
VYGSPDLVDELLRHDLVDEYRLLVYPVILGSGKRTCSATASIPPPHLVDDRALQIGRRPAHLPPDPVVPTSPFVEEYQWTSEQVRSLQAAEDIDRTLATVLFTDIVDSTGRAAAMGDRAWKKLLEQHSPVVQRRDRALARPGRRVLRRRRSSRCSTRPPAPCGAPSSWSTRRGTSTSRSAAGIHTGEIERHENGIGGIGVHIASRVLGVADRGQVVVTKTVPRPGDRHRPALRALGVTNLRGVPGEWELFEARTTDR